MKSTKGNHRVIQLKLVPKEAHAEEFDRTVRALALLQGPILHYMAVVASALLEVQTFIQSISERAGRLQQELGEEQGRSAAMQCCTLNGDSGCVRLLEEVLASACRTAPACKYIGSQALLLEKSLDVLDKQHKYADTGHKQVNRVTFW